MKNISTIDYAILDRPEVLMFLFHPRPESTGPFSKTAEPENRVSGQKDILIPVQDDIAIGARFHMAEKSGGTFFFSTATERLLRTTMSWVRYTTSRESIFWRSIIADMVVQAVNRPSPP